jgi:hypothetical protein
VGTTFQRSELGALVSLEMGKIRTEGIGEVQEFVDIVSHIYTVVSCLSLISLLANSAIMQSDCQG